MKTDIAYIYSLSDPRNNFVRYIGKTVNPKNRISGHIAESKRYNHHRAKWIRNLIKNGLVPKLTILKICPLCEYEIHEMFFINKYKGQLTNSDETGQGNKGRKSNIIQSVSNKLSKTVYQFNINGDFISEYKSLRSASKILGISHGNISKCCKGIFKHTSGYIFSYNRDIPIEGIKNPNAIKKSIIEIDSYGNEINKWISLMECSRDTKIDSGNLSRVCNGKLPSISGRFFKFKK